MTAKEQQKITKELIAVALKLRKKVEKVKEELNLLANQD